MIRLDREQIKQVAILVAIVSLALALYLGSLVLFAGASFGAAGSMGPTGAAGPDGPAKPRPCSTVTPQVFNRRTKTLDTLTGKRHQKASRKVCKTKYRELGQRVWVARKKCKRRARTSIASVYGPAHGDGSVTASGVHLTNSTLGVAHKTLPFFSKFYFRYHGRTVRASVIDRGPFIAGREWDLAEGVRSALGFPIGVDAVTTSRRNCWYR